MRSALFSAGVLLMSASFAASADFPPAEQLPKQDGYPELLTSLAGRKITTKGEWETVRRPELKLLFQQYMYGQMPEPAKVQGVLLHEDKTAFGGKGTIREVELQFELFGKKNPLPIHLLIAIPNDRQAPSPVFVGPNFGGNHLYTTDPKVLVPTQWMYPKYPGVKDNRATEDGRGKSLDTWSLELAISRGYAVATFYAGDIQPDRPTVSEGFRALMPPTTAEDATATIASWAWGVSRCVDYLVTLPELDAKRIAVVGHSRLGKTALLAGAFDERLALVIPHQAGCGGTGPSRHNDAKAEGVKRINISFPHWFSTSFKRFNNATEKLPFDQHCLAALCAPRPVLYTNAAEDLWANPSGQFEMLKLASPVYELLGVEGLKATAMPEPGRLVSSRVGYGIRAGVHSMVEDDWKFFLEFADKWLK
jgi:hypothetical protein